MPYDLSWFAASRFFFWSEICKVCQLQQFTILGLRGRASANFDGSKEPQSPCVESQRHVGGGGGGGGYHGGHSPIPQGPVSYAQVPIYLAKAHVLDLHSNFSFSLYP